MVHSGYSTQRWREILTMQIKLFKLLSDGYDDEVEARVNDFVTQCVNDNARIVSIEISTYYIMVVYDFLPETRDPQ